MKRFVLSLLILLSASPAFADWYWLKSGDYYVRSNGTDNDGWYYRRECSYGCSYHCSRCNYVKVKQITPDVYSPNFEEQAMKLLERREVRNQRIDLLGKMFGGQASGYSSSGYGSSYSATEFVRQGVYGGGNTVMAVGEHYGAQNVDYLTPLQEQQRLMEGMQGLLGQGLAGTNYAATQSVEIAKINAYRDLGVASIRAAQQPTETYRTWNQKPGEVSQGTFHSSGAQSNTTEQLIVGIGHSLRGKDCASCHRPNSAKGAPEFVFDLIEKEEVRRRLDLPTDDPQHMPGGKGGKMYSDVEKTALLLAWSADTIVPSNDQPQRQYRPRVQTQEQPMPLGTDPEKLPGYKGKLNIKSGEWTPAPGYDGPAPLLPPDLPPVPEAPPQPQVQPMAAPQSEAPPKPEVKPGWIKTGPTEGVYTPAAEVPPKPEPPPEPMQ